MSSHLSRQKRSFYVAILFLLFAFGWTPPFRAAPKGRNSVTSEIAVGAQYDSTHVYVSPAEFDAFVNSFITTFGGKASKKIVTNVLPVPSKTENQYVSTPVGTLSVFGFETPVPFPFGQERTGYLVTNMKDAIVAARDAGAEVIVEPFQDPIGLDAVIRWDGGVAMQLYWHFTPPSQPPLTTVPENRVYLSPDRADVFVHQFTGFAHGSIVSDNKVADAGEIGRPGQSYRRIRIESHFGKMQIFVTDGHLPYPFGREIMGYEVIDLNATVIKASAAGAKILSAPYQASDRISAILQFPGGYIAEVHASSTH